MTGATALIAQPGLLASSSIKWYTMNGKSNSDVTPSGQALRPGSSVTQTNGRTTLQFEWPIPADGSADILWAYGTYFCG